MTPLEVLQAFIDVFRDTEFEVYANWCVFAVFIMFVLATIRTLLPHTGITKVVRFVYENVGLGIDEIRRNMELAPGAQSKIDRVAPYFDLLAFSFYFLTFLLFSILVGILPAMVEIPTLKGKVLIGVLLLGGLLISRASLARATWAWYHICNR